MVLSATGRAQDGKLTVDQAKKLLPRTAGISNTDLRALTEDRRPEAVKNKSLSLLLLTLTPPAVKNAEADKEFHLFDDRPRPVSDVLEAMWISKGEGYASFIQPKYITDCTCESTADRAEGVVTFKSDLFAGRIPFAARATTDGWVITEFRLPQYKTRVVRGEDGVWTQEALPGKPGAAASPDDKHLSSSVRVRELQKERIATLNDVAKSSGALAKAGHVEFGEARTSRAYFLVIAENPVWRQPNELCHESIGSCWPDEHSSRKQPTTRRINALAVVSRWAASASSSASREMGSSTSTVRASSNGTSSGESYHAPSQRSLTPAR
jgi:hypothetical protein